MSTVTVSLYALSALLGVAPGVLRLSLARAGVLLSQNERATESDLARVFGTAAAREFVERAKDQGGRMRRPSPSLNRPGGHSASDPDAS